jgi:hypothetical protein
METVQPPTSAPVIRVTGRTTRIPTFVFHAVHRAACMVTVLHLVSARVILVISRTLQPTNVHQLAILLASMLTARHPTFVHVTWDTVRPLTTVIQRVFLFVKMGASMDSALLRVSAPAIPATP